MTHRWSSAAAEGATRSPREPGLSRQVVDEHAHSSAPPEAVWRLASDSRTWSEWGAWSKAEILREGSPPPNGVHTVRRLTSFPRVVVVEEITLLDEPRRLVYELRSGLPLRAYRGEITLREAGGVTQVRWRSEFEPKIPGTGGFYRRVLASFTAAAVARLASAAERL